VTRRPSTRTSTRRAIESLGAPRREVASRRAAIDLEQNEDHQDGDILRRKFDRIASLEIEHGGLKNLQKFCHLV
jgi:hypothetical protein